MVVNERWKKIIVNEVKAERERTEERNNGNKL